jgi:hypothetical protein
VLCAAIAAVGALVLRYNQPAGVPLPDASMVCLTTLALLACGERRPSRRWLWPVVLVAVWPLVAEYLARGVWVLHFPALAAPMALLSLLWVAVDARPAVATGVFALAFWLQPGIANVVAGPDIPAAVPLLIVSALVPFAIWRLHRQSGRAPARRES